jgi:signal transduction histidine kinase
MRTARSRSVSPLWRTIFVVGACIGLALALRAFGTSTHPRAVALTYILLVIGVSAWLGFFQGVTAAISSAFLYSLFLPPTGFFDVSSLTDWITLGLFVATAVITSYVATRLRESCRDENEKGLFRALPDYSGWIAFVAALAILSAIATAAYRTTQGLMESQASVAHTVQVEAVLEKLQSEILNSQALHRDYIIDGDPRELQSFYASVNATSDNLRRVKSLTADNPRQQERFDLIERLLQQRLALQQESIDLKQSSHSDSKRQAEITTRLGELTNEIVPLVKAVDREEKDLLDDSQKSSAQLYRNMLTVLAVAFAAASALLLAHFGLLTLELRRRKQAESIARSSADAARRLSARLLNLQDDERRRLSRELHDSLGQYLTSLKINLSLLQKSGTKSEQVIAECEKLLDVSLAETRTISYLLHPPLLDEAGLASAARWYVDGFASRSGIQVTLNMPAHDQRLPQPVELALFRVIQESLTNIHRHSKSSTAEIELKRFDQQVVLTVRDCGIGMPRELIENFQLRGAGVGVGLAGMRERVHEMGGRVEIQSTSSGTVVIASLPLPKTLSASVPKQPLPKAASIRDAG